MSRQPTHLRLQLASPAQFTGASAGGTDADTDVVTDEHGLPYYPRHRLAARLREGAVTAIRAHGDRNLLRTAEELLGTTRGGHEATRALRIGHAHPALAVRAAVAAAQQRREEEHPSDSKGELRQREAARTHLATAVTAAYAEEESGTQVDELGTPISGRLRTHRALRPGLVLWAELSWGVEYREEYGRLLALAALGTTAAGMRITRGRGRIDVRVAAPEEAEGTGADAAHHYTLRLAGIAATTEGAWS
ncbi:hypothetical protein RIF23_10325 [Lipingzhangella sp. LS1_29]|uniref:Uncharacterized protein n=1 Tax=Lipingzhangella rawalii TaxID=2055835 RepID=A0ABU2H7X9_9ACTN|nr:hypothetical protein [Lipingzhangella rawalii]MDS1270694.1 hypothetical protein [Lipingzhangella rawalii]